MEPGQPVAHLRVALGQGNPPSRRPAVRVHLLQRGHEGGEVTRRLDRVYLDHRGLSRPHPSMDVPEPRVLAAGRPCPTGTGIFTGSRGASLGSQPNSLPPATVGPSRRANRTDSESPSRKIAFTVAGRLDQGEPQMSPLRELLTKQLTNEGLVYLEFIVMHPGPRQMGYLVL